MKFLQQKFTYDREEIFCEILSWGTKYVKCKCILNEAQWEIRDFNIMHFLNISLKMGKIIKIIILSIPGSMIFKILDNEIF